MGMDIIRKIDALDEQVGGRFMLTALLQKRIQEVVRGAPSFADASNPIRAALLEIEGEKIEFAEADEDAFENLFGEEEE